MLAVRLEYSNRIEKIKITGDFFIYPESALAKIEDALIGTAINERNDLLSAKISKAVNATGAELIGITPEAIVSTIKMAIK